MPDLLLGIACVIVIALWWAVAVHAALAGVRSGRYRPGRGPKWGTFGPL